MARTVSITVPAESTDELLERLGSLSSVAGLQLQRHGSLDPPGDVIVVQVLNRDLGPLMRMLQEHGIGTVAGTSYTLSEPVALLAPSANALTTRESTDATWEEMNQLLARESSMTINKLLLLFASGLLAVVGMTTGSLHVVIAAMLIAPAFEPLTRISLGLVAGGSALPRGLIDTCRCYLGLIVGAVAGAGLLVAFGQSPLDADGGYLQPEALASYWSTIGAPSVMVSLAAATAGGILVATNRTVLTAGVMVGLALVPSASLAGGALVAGNFELASGALLRWSVDVAIVVTVSALIFLWKYLTVHRRAAQI